MAEKMSRENCPVYIKLMVLPAGPQCRSIPLRFISLTGVRPMKKDIGKFTFVLAQRIFAYVFFRTAQCLYHVSVLPLPLFNQFGSTSHSFNRIF